MKPNNCADLAQNLREQFKSFARFYAGSFHLFPTLIPTKTRDGFIPSQVKLALLSGDHLHLAVGRPVIAPSGP